MAWIRLSDNYVDHPKFQALSDGSFRLWHEAMSFCRRHQSDGFFSFQVMKGFRYYNKSRERQLATPYTDGANPLWRLVEGGGYTVHDYLEWNPSRDEENERRAESKERMRVIRERRQRPGIPPSVRTNTLQTTSLERSQVVLDTDTDKKEQILVLEKRSEEKTEARSKRPIFSGQRLTVFEWMLDECIKTLGEHCDAFDLHEWFFALDRLAVDRGLVIPKRDNGVWLQAQLVAEAQRRGLPLRMATAEPIKTEKDHEADTQRQADAVLALLNRSRIA